MEGLLGSQMGGPVDTLIATRHKFVYDAQEQIIEEERYNRFFGPWQAEARILRSYTANGDVLTEENFYWIGQWEASDFARYSYNSQNEPDSLTFYFWNGQSYEPGGRYIDVSWYDWNEVLPMTYIEQEYQGATWVNSYRFSYTYQLHNSYVGDEDEWDGQAWQLYGREKASFDSYGRETFSEYATLQNGIWEIFYGSQSDYDYDANGSLVAEEHDYYDTDSVAYIPYSRIEYQDFVLDRQTAETQTQMEIWPVPAHDVLNLRFSSTTNASTNYTILDLQGKTWQHGTLPGSKTHNISLPDMPKGIYLLKVQQNQEAITRKFLIF